jgi:ComF family protein
VSVVLRSSLVSRVLDLAIPAECAGCGRDGTAFCNRCAGSLHGRRDLPPGVPMGLRAAAPAPLAQLEWCAPFRGPVRAALHSLKYGGERRLAIPLAAAMAERWAAAGAGGELLCPVPIHVERLRRRGYDQAVLLAARLSDLSGLPYRAALCRSRNTRPQFDLGRRARLSNVSGAFAPTSAAEASSLRGLWVILVDDVATTGSTLVACAEVLYGAGAIAVSAVTVARER